MSTIRRCFLRKKSRLDNEKIFAYRGLDPVGKGLGARRGRERERKDPLVAWKRRGMSRGLNGLFGGGLCADWYL